MGCCCDWPRSASAVLVPRYAFVQQTEDATQNNVNWATLGQMSVAITPQVVGARFLIQWSASFTMSNSGFRGFFRVLDSVDGVLETQSLVGWNVNSPVAGSFLVVTPPVAALAARTISIQWAQGIAPAVASQCNMLAASDPNMYQSWLSVLELLPPT